MADLIYKIKLMVSQKKKKKNSRSIKLISCLFKVIKTISLKHTHTHKKTKTKISHNCVDKLLLIGEESLYHSIK